MKMRLMMLAMLAMACGSTVDQTELAAESAEPVEYDEEAEAFRVATEDALGRTIDLMPGDHGIRLEGEATDMFGAGSPEDYVGAEVDKTNMPVVWGWAMGGTNKLQAKNQSPKAHCETFGVSCDGMVHSQMNDTYVDSGTDFLADYLGRCGRFDSEEDNSFKPCAVPRAQKALGGKKNYKWKWDPDTCTNNAYGRSVIYWGAQQAFFGLDSVSDLNFTETTGSDYTILVACSGDVPSEAAAMGIPVKDMLLRYAANHVFEEHCETGDTYTPPTDGNGNFSYHFADMYYTYSNMGIFINWDGFAATLNTCGSTQTAHRNIARSIVMHELAHAFGFTHQSWTDTRGPGWHTELMSPSTTCNNLLYNASNWHPIMLQLINDVDVPNNATPLDIYNEHVSCLFPQ